MSRPLLPILWGYIGGILLEHYCNYSKWQSLTHLLLIYGLLGVVCWGCYLRSERLTSWIFLVFAVMIGITRYAMSTHLPIDHIAHIVEDERVSIEGFLYKPPEYIEKKRIFYVKTTWVEKNNHRYRTTGNIRITLTGTSFGNSGTKKFSYGDTIRARLRLSIPKDFGTVNYREYLRRQGIYLIGYLRHDRYVIKLPWHQGNPLLAWVNRLRNRIIHFLDTYVSISDQNSSEAIQVIKAMTLGQSRELSPELKEKFRHAALYHLLVVSGIHVGILALGSHWIVKRASIPLHYRSGILAIVLLFYTGLTGFHFPVLRAVIMALTFYFAITCNRIPDPLYSLAFAVGAILFLFPVSLFEVSFQLTVAATASILLFFRLLQEQSWYGRVIRLPRILRLPILSLLTTSGAMLGVAPLLIYYFSHLPVYTFISTLLALPIVGLLLPFSLLTNFSALLFQQWDWLFPLLSVNTLLAKCLIALASIFPEFRVAVSRPPGLVLMMYYIAVYGVFTYYRKPASETTDHTTFPNTHI